MANMSYCRFQNTALDLRNCLDHIHDRNLGQDEADARQRLLRLCQKVLEECENVTVEVDGPYATVEEYSDEDDE